MADKEMLLKAASLCREASRMLKDKVGPEKQASEVVDDMIRRAGIPEGNRQAYTQFLTDNPEKIAAFGTLIGELPGNYDAIGEAAQIEKEAGAVDAFDRFLYS